MTAALRELHITGFGSLADVSLQPDRVTVLIGPNGAGKSNLLRALRMIPLMRTGSLQRFVGEEGGASALLHYGPKKTQAIEIKILFQQDDHQSTYQARLGFAAGDRLLYLEEAVIEQASPEDSPQHTSLGAGHWESALRAASAHDATAAAMDRKLSKLTFFHFHDTSMTSALRTYARAADDRYLRSDGSNLAAWLLRLQQGEDESARKAWRRINQLLAQIVPSLKELAPTPVNGASVRLDWIDDQDERFGVHQLSDGTLRAIALITALAQPTHALPLFMSIDEPELGLHPAALHLVAELARSVSRHTQILFATQSTALLDHFEPAEVVVVERKHGATTLHRLEEDAPRFDGWVARLEAL